MTSFFSGNLIHTITYARPATTVNAAGDPSTVAAQVPNVPARVEGKRELVRGPDGTEVVTEHKIMTETEIKMGDRIWVPHLGDDVSKVGDARHPVSISSSERLKGGGTRLYVVFL